MVIWNKGRTWYSDKEWLNSFIISNVCLVFMVLFVVYIVLYQWAYSVLSYDLQMVLGALFPLAQWLSKRTIVFMISKVNVDMRPHCYLWTIAIYNVYFLILIAPTSKTVGSLLILFLSKTILIAGPLLKSTDW